MSTSFTQLGFYLFAALAGGVVVGWMIYASRARRMIEKLQGEWQVKFTEATRQRDKFNADNSKLRTSIEAQQAMLHKHEVAATRGRTEIESMREKQKSLSKDLISLRSERDDQARQLQNQTNAMAAAKRQIGELEAEFVKSGDFYKGELGKALEKRKSLESKLEDAKAEQGSLANLLNAARAESASVNKMLVAAQTRLDNLDDLERKAIALEAENAELRHDASNLQREIQALQRDVAELEELKAQNRELSHCLKSMENSRKQYEVDAKRYRDQADHSDKQSETLRIKLEDIEKNLASMSKQQDEARKHVRTREAKKASNGSSSPPAVIDDLTEIVGIGKVFQHTLHKLGVYSFQQIANFGPADIARVNLALKESRGRMEQDDWIGQAKELYFKKQSERVEQ